MKKRLIRTLLLVVSAGLAAACNPEPEPAQELEPIPENVPIQGFYKDIFMDGGISLTSRTSLPVSSYLYLTMEFFASGSDVEKMTAVDTAMQTAVMSHSDEDENGVLLYPDGSPRFRMIYMNGGKSGQHGLSLNSKGSQGLKRIREYYANGGSYVGTCAGAYLCSTGSGTTTNPNYAALWPGYCYPTGMSDTYTSMTVEPGCPLLKYYDFGGDGAVDNIRHNGGCYLTPAPPKGTEVLLRYYCPDTVKVHGQGSIWAYKKSDTTGRVVACGSHPEGVTSGERRDLMAAMCRYAMDGQGSTRIKDTLRNGEIREMTSLYSENKPDHARIGDKQYHHFAVYVPERARDLEVKLSGAAGSEGYNLELYLKKGTFAYPDVEPLSALKAGTEQTVFEASPTPGLWLVAVRCPDTVTAEKVTYDNQNGETGTWYKYSGKTAVLNGIPYTISVSWKE